MGDAVTVAVVGGRDLAAEFAKKGTQSDITMYNAVRDGRAATFIEPTQFPEKLAPLLTALAMADRTLLHVPGLTREIAETVAAVDLFETPVEVVVGPGAGEAELKRAFKGTRVETATYRSLDVPKLRQEVESWVTPPREGSVLVRLDHAFPVKGVGAVALGVVRRGTLNAHDRLRLYPTEKAVEVRSIQVHDVEVRSATTAERVGVALKGVEAEELSRGQVLAPEGSLHVSRTISATWDRRCPYYRGKITDGAAAHLLLGLQFVPAKVLRSDERSISLEADRPVAFERGEAGVLADLSAAPGPRVAGRIRCSSPSEG